MQVPKKPAPNTAMLERIELQLQMLIKSQKFQQHMQRAPTPPHPETPWIFQQRNSAERGWLEKIKSGGGGKYSKKLRCHVANSDPPPNKEKQ